MSQKTEKTDRFRQAVEQCRRPWSLPRRFVHRVLRALPERVRELLRPASPVARALTELARSRKDVVFVQIGSCDGTTDDPLYEHVIAHGWSGVVVEPVSANFARLVESYRGARGVRCENVAVSDRDEVRPFYHVEAAGRDLPDWAHEVGSFYREHPAKHALLWPEIEEHIRETPVECVTLRRLLDRNGIDRMDVLHTDAEGFDFHILQQVDFDRYQPELILFEDLHMRDAERAEAARMLRARGYTLLSDGMNTLARRTHTGAAATPTGSRDAPRSSTASQRASQPPPETPADV